MEPNPHTAPTPTPATTPAPGTNPTPATTAAPAATPAGKRHHRSAEADLRDEIRPTAGKRHDQAAAPHGGNEIRWRTAAELAASQQGVATTAQLRALGLSYDEILLAADTGRLHRIHRGVYLVGHTAMAPLAREQAALLACGEAAILSHVSAAALWQLRPSSPIVDVTVVGRRIRRRQAIRLHVVGHIDRADVSRRYGLPVTSAARTLVDLAAVLEPEPLEAALSEAYALRRITERKLHAAVERNQGRPGAATLRALLTAQQGPTITKSRAERLLRALLRRAGLPQPLSNQPLLGHPVDILWPEQHLIVEFDGFQWHGHRAKFETDRGRDAKLVAAGYRVIRITWRQLTETPFVVIANIARALGG